MSAYLVAHIEITDPEAFKAYADAVPAVVKAFGGRYIVRGGEPDVREGNWTVPRLVIIQFDSMEELKTWYNSPEYQAAIPLRLRSARDNFVCFNGL